MFPVIVKIGPLTVHSYGLLMAVGVAFGIWFMYVQAKKQGLDAEKLADAAFYTIIVALVGAKLVLLFSDFSRYTKYPAELLSLARSGGVFQGGLVFGAAFALLYFRKKKIPTWKAADIIGPALALGHGFGRIGCFAAGCCYGQECSTFLGATYHSEYAHQLTGIPLGKPLHPVQLYEAVLNFLNFFILFRVLKKKTFDGQVFTLYIINYSVIRYFTEFFRGDHAAKTYFIQGGSPFVSVSYPQLFCLFAMAAAIFLSRVFKKSKRA